MARGGYEYADKIYFAECVLQDPGNPIYAQTFLANLKKKFGDKKKKPSSFVSAGKKLVVDARKPENVFKVNIEALQSNPWDIESLIATGKACEALGYPESAIIYFQAAIDVDPNHLGANTVCCAALREAADYDGAIVCAQRVLKRQPNNHDIRKRLNDLYAEKAIHKGKYAQGRQPVDTTAVPEDEDVMGRSLTVEEQIERRIAKNPLDTANYAELAQWYYRQSELVKAEECYARAVSVSQDAPEMVEQLLDAQKKRLRAEALRLKEEYEKNPNEELKSVFFSTRDQYDDKCMELAQHRVKHYPEHTGYRYEYGTLLKKRGHVKEAITEFQFAKSEPSRLGECLLALGQCFQMIKQYKLAMTHYDEALQTLESGDSKKKALYSAMKLAFALEDYSLAETYGHQLAAIDFSYRDIGDLLEQLAQYR